MSKLIKINDRKPMEIYIGRKTRGPIVGVRLSDAVIGRILRSVDAPKDVYAMGPNNALVKLTLDNYMKSEEELFGLKKETTPVVNELEAKVKAEALKKSLEAKKITETVKSEPEAPVVTEEVVAAVTESEVQNTEKVDEVIKNNVSEEAPVEEIVVTPTVVEDKKEAPVKNYNNYNYNKNYNKNKNRK